MPACPGIGHIGAWVVCHRRAAHATSKGLLRDLQDLHVLATRVQTSWTAIAQGAQGLRDTDLLDVAQSANADTSRQLSWFNTMMKATAPQALIVASWPRSSGAGVLPAREGVEQLLPGAW